MKICGISLNRRFGVGVVESLTLIPPHADLPLGEDEKTLAYTLSEMKEKLFWIIDQAATHEELRSEDILGQLYRAYYANGEWHPFRSDQPYSVVLDQIEKTEEGADLHLRIVDIEGNQCQHSQVLSAQVVLSDWTEAATGGTPFIEGESVLPIPGELLGQELHLYLSTWQDDVPCAHITLTPEMINELHGDVATQLPSNF